MSNTNTGGPAFPHIDSGCGRFEEGMTLRDYFAAKAMEALMTSDKYGGIVGINNYEHNRAKDAYMVADAMLKARGA